MTEYGEKEEGMEWGFGCRQGLISKDFLSHVTSSYRYLWVLSSEVPLLYPDFKRDHYDNHIPLLKIFDISL